MSDIEIQKIIDQNNRLCLVLGYAMGFIMNSVKIMKQEDKEKYKWLVKSIENLIYIDKPLTPMP